MTVSYFAILSALLIDFCKLAKRILGECRAYKLNTAKYNCGKSAYRCGCCVKSLVKGDILVLLYVRYGISGL